MGQRESPANEGSGRSDAMADWLLPMRFWQRGGRYPSTSAIISPRDKSHCPDGKQHERRQGAFPRPQLRHVSPQTSPCFCSRGGHHRMPRLERYAGAVEFVSMDGWPRREDDTLLVPVLSHKCHLRRARYPVNSSANLSVAASIGIRCPTCILYVLPPSMLELPLPPCIPVACGSVFDLPGSRFST